MEVYLAQILRCWPQYTVRGLSCDLWSAVWLVQHELWKSMQTVEVDAR